jgi:cell division protein FtsI (penicillin-binding protein 3)
MYLASFAGYFPADNPKYSLIVTVNNPRGGLYYGGSVAGPVFKEIAERTFAVRNMFEESAEENEDENRMPVLPDVQKGQSKNIMRVAQELKLENISGTPETLLTSVTKSENRLILGEYDIQDGKMPDVRGMGASDAVFILENAGLRVKIKGAGKVKNQSAQPGSGFTRGDYVYLTLG